MSTTAYWLGRVEYADGLELQRQFQRSRIAGEVPDTLLLLEHPAVLTMGRAAKAQHVLASPTQLERLGVQYFETDRGGDVTYHGPGQLVGYPLLFLAAGKQDVRRYVRKLEEVVISVLRHFGVTGTRVEKYPGVWVETSKLGGTRKVAALGVHLSRWYTRHGFALNVSPNLEHFGLIVPCGIAQAGVTSIEAETGLKPALDEVARVTAQAFASVFETPIAFAEPEAVTVAVAVLRKTQPAQALLMHRVPAKGDFWQLVTGSQQPGETVEDAAARELFEETGLKVQPEPLEYVQAFAFGDHTPPKVYRAHGFVAHVDAETQVRLAPQEHSEARWAPFAEAIAQLPHAGLRETLRRAYSSTR